MPSREVLLFEGVVERCLSRMRSKEGGLGVAGSCCQ